jgi:hypothetical protein
LVAQPLSDFLNSSFIEAAAKELRERGFVTDEHNFAPYRETMGTHVDAIEAALRNAGHDFELVPGFVEHPQAGYAYYIYDEAMFEDAEAAKKAVSKWLDRLYADR